MKYLQKLFVHSMRELYSDIIKVELDTLDSYHISLKDDEMQEKKLPFKWEEVWKKLVDSICYEDQESVIERWKSCVNEEAKDGDSFIITYRTSEQYRKNGSLLRTLQVTVVEEDAHKVVWIFSKAGEDGTATSNNHVNLKVRAEIDDLTGLNNRIKLDAMVAEYYVDMKSCGVLFWDLNNLKAINQSFGRAVGDKAVRRAADSIRDLQNENIQAYRYTGDKLLLIAKDCTREELRKMIDSWVAKWTELSEKEKAGNSIAIGAAWESAPVAILELISKANAEMHRNKELMKEGVPLEYYIQGEIPCSYGLRGRKQFFDLVDFRLQNEPGEYCLIAIDIEHFKLFNKWYGRKAGDEFLEAFAAELKKYEEEYNGIASYFGGDNFTILLPANEQLLEKVEKDLTKIALKLGDSLGFLPGIGVYYIDSKEHKAIEMYDYAVEALAYVKGDFEKRTSFYDKNMTKRAEEELRILSEARDALKEGHFTIYFQPKCRIKTKQIVGAEALIRWKHPVKGLIPPGLFIPVLEKNGFISDVDQYVWELACKQIREWMDAGIQPVPISINISRIDILSIDVVKTINDLVEKYQIDKNYIKVELTEGAYVDNSNKVVDAVQKMREKGYVLLMDDFGSGYSSLNMLKELEVDVIKMDMKFLDIDKEDMKKGLSILKSVISMSNEIEVPLIAEGVETEDQANFLGDMGVRFAQGYLYYKPMPVEEFTKLIAVDSNVDRRGVFSRVMDAQHWEESVEKVLAERMNRYNKVNIRKTRGGFISYKAGGNQELLGISKSVIAMYECSTEEEFREYVGNSFIGMVHPDDRYRVGREINEQIPDTEWKMDYIEYRIITKKGNIRYINDYGHLEENTARKEPIFYVLLLDVTDRLEKNEDF